MMQCCVDVDELRLSSQEPLQQMQRSNCPKCGKKMGFYCFDCIVPLTAGVPRLQLPVQVDVVQHGESNGRATGTHAALLAPDHVQVWRHNDGTSHHRRQDPLSLELPDFDPETTVVLYPESKDTPAIGAPDCPSFSRAIVLEGSWQKAKGLLMRHPKLQGLKRVQLPGDVRTVYWRRGAGSFKGVVDEGVCTIECVYYLCRSLDQARCYDDLLWYFTWIRSLVVKQAAPMTAHYLKQMEAARQERKQKQQQGQGKGASAEGAAAGSADGEAGASEGAGVQGQQQGEQGAGKELTRREREELRLAQQRAFKAQKEAQQSQQQSEQHAGNQQQHPGQQQEQVAEQQEQEQATGQQQQQAGLQEGGHAGSKRDAQGQAGAREGGSDEAGRCAEEGPEAKRLRAAE